MSKSYQDLDIYKISFELFIQTHKLTLKLPNYEKFELGSQLRRSANSINANIVEGYGRNSYKRDFVKFLIYALASNDETISHLKKLAALYPNFKEEISPLIAAYNKLGKKIFNFKEFVIKSWR